MHIQNELDDFYNVSEAVRVYMRHDDAAAITDEKLTETTIRLQLKGVPDFWRQKKKRQAESQKQAAGKKLLLNVQNSADDSSFYSGRQPLTNLTAHQAAGDANPSISDAQVDSDYFCTLMVWTLDTLVKLQLILKSECTRYLL